ncbi:hypothetical protein JVT61DRAFT_2774 [Boletus reticuloceps]|uniref:Uncharacterized protein n=1 Tax=Boletus reticuloceps TaxID=495285 RepID=A0A8I3AAP4_9AGAM|nr:hypothetical protein JVT61DRAFT_2774 [Boletus reticuloceps]
MKLLTRNFFPCPFDLSDRFRPLDVLLPLLIFPFLTFTAFHIIVHQSLFQSGLQFKISAICEPDLAPHPYRLPYTSITNVDTLLCGLVVFFHALIDTASTACLAVLFPAFSIVALIPFLEAARDRRPFALRMPTAIGVLIQLASAGVIMPLYALLLVITRTASLRPSTTPTPSPPSKINRGNAEALLFGLILGYILPTILMLSFARPTVTAVWQGVPLLVALAILVHKIIRPPSRLVQSGHPTVVVTLAFSFLLSALLHVVYVWPVLTDTAALRTIFAQVVDVSDPAATTLADGVLEFIKWDFIFGVGSMVLATFWMADSLLSLVGIIVWYGIASIAVGPAAAIAGVLLWRERRLNGKSQVEKVPQKME